MVIIKLLQNNNIKKYSLSKNKRHDLKSIYESYRCQLCFDQMNIFSDIVVGDPWGIVRPDIKKGYSVFITRTKKGEQIVQEAIKNGAIKVDEIAVSDILKGQTVDNRLMTNFFIAKRICQDNDWDCELDSEYSNHPVVRKIFIELGVVED